MADVHQQLLDEYNDYNQQQTLQLHSPNAILTPLQKVLAALTRAHNLRNNLMAASPIGQSDIAAIERINFFIANSDTLLERLQATLPGLGRAGRIRRVGRAGW